MKTNLTPKQKKFLDAYLSGKNLAESARYAGSEGKDVYSLSAIGNRMLKNIKLDDEEIADSKGLNEVYFFQKLKSGCESVKPVVSTWEGKITDERFYEDKPTQHKYLDLLGKKMGWVVEKVELTGRDGGEMVIQITPAESKRKKKVISL